MLGCVLLTLGGNNMFGFFVLGLCFAFLAFLKTRVGAGMLGEWIIRLVIGQTNEEPGKEKFVINNLLLQLENGRSSQIDHVVINKSGVHVIETKNYSGRIYGNDSQHEWTQVLNYGKVKNHFYSPVKQNFTHVYMIKERLPQNVPVHSIIVFTKSNIKYINSKFVCTPWDINNRLNKEREELLTLEEMKGIYTLLNEKNTNTILNSIEHVNHIQEMKEGIENNICPRCNGQLIEKRGKYGSFLACSNYPDCKFTKKIEK